MTYEMLIRCLQAPVRSAERCPHREAAIRSSAHAQRLLEALNSFAPAANDANVALLEEEDT